MGKSSHTTQREEQKLENSSSRRRGERIAEGGLHLPSVRATRRGIRKKNGLALVLFVRKKRKIRNACTLQGTEDRGKVGALSE